MISLHPTIYNRRILINEFLDVECANERSVVTSGCMPSITIQEQVELVSAALHVDHAKM